MNKLTINREELKEKEYSAHERGLRRFYSYWAGSDRGWIPVFSVNDIPDWYPDGAEIMCHEEEYLPPGL